MMSTPNSGSAGNGDSSESLGVPGNLGSMPDIQLQLSARSRQIRQLAARLADSERQRAGEVANASAVRVVSQADEGW